MGGRLVLDKSEWCEGEQWWDLHFVDIHGTVTHYIMTAAQLRLANMPYDEGVRRATMVVNLGMPYNIPAVSPEKALAFDHMTMELSEAFPILSEQSQCPICGQKDEVADNIMHLNDDHKVTRAFQAEWVDTLG